MIILPAHHDYRVLMPQRRAEWRAPSQARPKDQFGNEDSTWFRLTARLHDGHVVWRGWFQDREDADAFLWALARYQTMGEPIPADLWRLPTPHWHPDIAPYASYDFATLVFLSTGAGSNQTYTSPSDWNNSNNKIETLGGGGGGGAVVVSGHAAGGGGGAYNAISNFSFASPGTTTAIWRAGAGATSLAVTTTTVGNAGGDSWFGGASLAAASVGSKAGSGGAAGSGSQTGGAGGVGSSGVGTSNNSGGAGGSLTGASGIGAAGGGGAAGPNGAGNDGDSSSSTSTNTVTNGGQGDGSSGGAGGTGSTTITSGLTGSAGTEWQASPAYGSGGGSGGRSNSGGSISGGAPGNYGAGSGGVRGASGTTTVAAGAQGLVVLTYTPPSTGRKSLHIPTLIAA